MKNRRGLVLIASGLLLLLAALSLAGRNLLDERRAEGSAQAVMARLTSLLPQSAPSPGVPDYVLAPQMEMPTAEIEGERYVGYLSIPALELELPVLEEWSYAGLKQAPCRYSGSAYQEDLVICAHNYRRHFGSLGALSHGDEVDFVDMDGNIFRYTVAELEELPPDGVEDMTSGDYPLTLFTCTFGGRRRVTLRCQRQEAAA